MAATVVLGVLSSGCGAKRPPQLIIVSETNRFVMPSQPVADTSKQTQPSTAGTRPPAGGARTSEAVQRSGGSSGSRRARNAADRDRDTREPISSAELQAADDAAVPSVAPDAAIDGGSPTRTSGSVDVRVTHDTHASRFVVPIALILSGTAAVGWFVARRRRATV